MQHKRNYPNPKRVAAFRSGHRARIVEHVLRNLGWVKRGPFYIPAKRETK